ncbi:hypothetical protein GCM10009718_30560 [Isoptericola halotolerans]
MGPIVAAPAAAAPAATSAVAVPAAVAAAAPTSALPARLGTALKSSKPTIKGAARVGNRLTAKPGTWAKGTTFSYTWKVGGKKVATGKTFTPKKKHLGKKVTVTVKGKKSGSTATRTSGSKKVAKGTFAAPKPKVSGTAKVGATLIAKPGTWKPKPAKLRYQWLANGKAIKGATSKKFTIKNAQHGKKITVRVKATRSAYKTRSRVSAATAQVVRKPAIRTQPSSVMVDAGKTAKMTVAATGGGLKYQWQRKAPGSSKWANLSGKTSSTLSFKTQAKDTLGEYRVVVKNAAGTVRSKSAILFVESTQTQPYPADTIYVGNYWMQVVGETGKVELDDSTFGLYAFLYACPLDDDVSSRPYWDLDSAYQGAKNKTWYAGTEWDEGVDSDGCGLLEINASVPKTQAKGGIWSITDYSGSQTYYPTTQYVAGLK